MTWTKDSSKSTNWSIGNSKSSDWSSDTSKSTDWSGGTSQSSDFTGGTPTSTDWGNEGSYDFSNGFLLLQDGSYLLLQNEGRIGLQ